MKRINLNTVAPSVKRFIRDLDLGADGVELELGGQVICKLLPANQLSELQKQALLKEGRELIQQARARNRGVPHRVIVREVREAVRRVKSST